MKILKGETTMNNLLLNNQQSQLNNNISGINSSSIMSCSSCLQMWQGQSCSSLSMSIIGQLIKQPFNCFTDFIFKFRRKCSNLYKNYYISTH